MPSKKKNKNKPKQGWVVELKEAETEAKTASNHATPQQHLRVARAARKLRIWNKCKTAAEAGFTIDPGGPLRAQLMECQKQADAELSLPSEVDSDDYKAYKANTPEGRSVKISHKPHVIFSNLHLLQYATLMGDVRLLEDLVESGLALDYPVLQANIQLNECHYPDAEPAPNGSTALVLCCAILAGQTWLFKTHGYKQHEWASRTSTMMVECAILLVKLGADFHRKLILDPPSQVCGRGVQVQSTFHLARFDGKMAQQLAQMAQHPELVKAMEELQSKEKVIALVYCRCGSRLPWKECHAGNSIGESPIYEEKGGRLLWRFSPSARCMCGLTKKTHYKCCWKESCTPVYLDDCDGRGNIAWLAVRVIAKQKVETTQFLLEGEGWSNQHWRLPKAELLYLVKQWNIGLEKCCEKKGLTGPARESFIEKNCATPYAACGNASCTNIETEVKEFCKCSKCKSIAYCSRECQRKGWKDHKESCHAE